MGEPLAIQPLFGATRTQPRPREIGGGNWSLPDCVQRSGRAGVHALHFRRVEPDAAAAAIANIECHAAGALFAQRLFTCGTFHNIIVSTSVRQTISLPLDLLNCASYTAQIDRDIGPTSYGEHRIDKKSVESVSVTK